MKINSTLLLTALTACTAFLGVNMQAGPVTNWHTFRATTATTLSGQGTSSPVYGSTNLTASGSFLIGYLDALSLTNVGDRITFSFQASFTDAVGMANAMDNFRFALFDLNGQTPVTAENTASAGVNGQTDDWRGYWFGVRHPTGVGSIRERIAALVSGDNAFAATGDNNPTAPSLGSVGGDGVNFLSSTGPEGGPPYLGVMALEKTPAGVALAGLFGGNGATNLFAVNDDATPFPVNYAAVGYLNGGPLSCDQINFQNVTVTYSFSNALQITSQPADVSVTAGQPAQFSVTWSGSGIIPYFQWRENGADILDATNATYPIASTAIGQDGFTYSVVVSNVFGDSVTSSDATLTVITDTNAPLVLSVSSVVSNSLNVVFSEPVDPVTAQDTGSYTLAGNSISLATLIGTTNVLVTLDNPITTNYTLTVQNVKDISGNPVVTTNVPGIAHGFQESLSVLISDGLGFALNEKVVVQAGGSDIFGASDQFQFVYRSLSGDFDVAVRVESLVNTDGNAKAGLMARVNTFFDSRNVMMTATPGRFIFQYRTNTAGANSFAVASPRPPTAFPNSWVRLVRSGAVFTGYSSTNLGVWDLIASYDTSIDADGAYPADILVGLAVTSHDVNEVTEAVFSDFLPSLAIARIGNKVELSWPSWAIGFTLQATASLTSPIMWTNVTGSSMTNRLDFPADSGSSFFRLIR